MGKKIKNSIIYIIIFLSVKFLRILGRKTAINIISFAGKLGFSLAKREREKTINNLQKAFGSTMSQSEINSLAKKVFATLSICAADAVRLPVLIRQGLDNIVTSEGMHHLDNAIAKGKGVILLTAHFGNWELLGAWLAQSGRKIKVIGKESYDSRIDKMIVGMRNNAGYENISRGKSVQKIVKSLSDNYIIGILADQDTKIEGVFVDFFGHPAHSAVGPILLARKFDVPVVPVFIRLRKDLTYHVFALEEIVLEDTGDKERDLVANTEKYTKIFENVISQYPEQWVWMHERWKKTPPPDTQSPVK